MPKGKLRPSPKIHPKLRMVANGSDVVNCLRAELSATIVSTLEPAAAKGAAEPVERIMRAPGKEADFAAAEALRKTQKLDDAGHADNAFVSVFIEVQRDRTVEGALSTASDIKSLSADIRSWMKAAGRRAPAVSVLAKRNLIAATVPVSRLAVLAEDPRVAFVHPAEAIARSLPQPPLLASAVPAPTPRAPPRAIVAEGGDGVIVGIIDVGGFDFSHEDFRAADGGTRFLSIWDQGGRSRATPAKNRPGKEAFATFSTGSEITREQMNAAIADGSLPGSMLEPQSQMSPGSHGTHVASIAAGNHGVCPQADIVAVLLELPRSEDPGVDRRLTFADASRITLAVEYLLEVAREQNRPIAINISLGTNGGPHDGAGGVSRWLDALLATEGRALCVAAGNAGQEKGESAGDMGWIMGRIHASGRVPARGLEVDLLWTVLGNGIVDVSENELEIWYSPQDRLTVSVRPPGGDWIEAAPREFVENRRLPSGTRVSIYNELYNPVNGSNYCAVYLSPELDRVAPKGVQAGTWTVRLKGDEIRDGSFHAWIERDDFYEFDGTGGRRVARLPSFFTEASNVDSHSIGSLACGQRVIAVANLDEARQRVNISSSQGPTRDSRAKPEVAAPGTDIVAANGFSYGSDSPWIAMTGTSMAAPYVTGLIGQMLAIDRTLTAAQCSGILQRTSRPLPGAGYAWINDCGYGRVDPAAALQETREFNQRRDIT